LKELGTAPGGGAPIKVMKGRYGPYVTDGKVNATLPRDSDPASVTLEEALALIAARAEKGPAKKKGRSKSAPAAKPKAVAERKAAAPTAKAATAPKPAARPKRKAAAKS
jgi:DNA topoisomerase-1